MKRTLPFLLALCMAAAFAQGLPGKTPGGDMTIIACSDLIILASVSTIVSPEAPTDTTNIVVPPIVSHLTITVNQVLRGEAKVGDKIQVSVVRNPSYVRNAAGDTELKGYTPDVQEKQQSIFYLQKAPGGYAVVSGALGIKDGVATTDVEDAIKGLVVSTTCEVPKAPFYFGKGSDVKVTVKNDGTDAVDITGIFTDGFYYAARMDPISITRPNDPTLPTAKTPLSVAAGASVSVTLKGVSVAAPQAWVLFGPESYLETVASVRAKVNLQVKGATTVFYTIASSWSPIIVGYEPPADAVAKATTPPTTP